MFGYKFLFLGWPCVCARRIHFLTLWESVVKKWEIWKFKVFTFSIYTKKLCTKKSLNQTLNVPKYGFFSSQIFPEISCIWIEYRNVCIQSRYRKCYSWLKMFFQLLNAKLDKDFILLLLDCSIIVSLVNSRNRTF